MKATLNRIVWIARGLVVCGGVGLISCGSSELPTATELSVPVPGESDTSLEGRVRAEVNRYRVWKSKGVLKRHPGLDAMAREHSRRMLREQKVSHKDYHKRLGLAEVQLQVEDLRENVFYSRGIGEADLPARTVRGWFESDGHRMNLLANTHYCGIGVAQDGEGRYYVTQLLGKPMNVKSFYHEGMPRSYSNVYGVGAGGAEW